MKKYFVFFLISALFLYLERGEMFSRLVMEETSEFTALNYVITLLLIITGTYLLSNWKFLPHEKLSRSYIVFTSVIYTLTVLWFFVYGLDSRNVLGYALVPLFMYLYMNTFTRKIEDEKIIITTIYLIVLVLAYYYFNNYYSNVLYLYDAAHVTNSSYTILYFLPFLLCAKKKSLRIVSIFGVLMAVMYSLKRGGFVALISGVVVYLYIDQISIQKKRIRLWGWVLLALTVVGLFVLINRVNNVILGDMLVDRFLDPQVSDGSGRMSIYRGVFYRISTSSIINILFGHGWFGTARDTVEHLTAHNDFLEVFYDFGIFAFVLYIIFIVRLVKLCGRLIKNKSQYAPAMGASLAIFFVNSMVSHILIYCQYMIIFAVFWGFISAIDNKK